MKDPASKGVGFYCKKSLNKVAKRLGSYVNIPYLYISRKGNESQSLKQRDMTKVKEFVAVELKQLERGFVATPASFNDLLAFAKANQGSMDIILMQMAIQYGAKAALENVAESIALLEMTAEYNEK